MTNQTQHGIYKTITIQEEVEYLKGDNIEGRERESRNNVDMHTHVFSKNYIYNETHIYETSYRWKLYKKFQVYF